MADNNSDMDIYRQLSAEMRDGLKNIYHQTAEAVSHGCPTDALFTEASGQLDEVVKTTEKAAMNIMEIVEKQQDAAQESGRILERFQNGCAEENDVRRLQELNQGLVTDLTTLVTNLSFQDIAGQRIKKVISALGKIEQSVLELYLSSGLMLDAAEKDPARDAADLSAEARKAVREYNENRQSQLKGPDNNGCSQGAIDDMLAQLGL